jgi:ubiquitin carboxyl-terminal hydrolase 5/13
MEVIESVADQCRVATPHDAVLNSECCYTFHTPFTTDQGILVNLHTFTGTVDSMSMLYGPEKAIFVRIVKQRVEKPQAMDVEDVTIAPPTKLAIGIDGGFLSEEDKYEVVSTYSVVVLQKTADGGTPQILADLPYTEDSKSTFPEAVRKSVDSVLNHVGVSTQQEVHAWQADEEIPVSKFYADLPFVDNGVVIDPNPSAWKCEKTGSTENLWLNLSDGYIGGGRKNWDVRSGTEVQYLHASSALSSIFASPGLVALFCKSSAFLRAMLLKQK